MVYAVFEDVTAADQVLSGLGQFGRLQSRYQLAEGHLSRGAACCQPPVLMCYRGLIPFCFNVGEFDRFLATGDSFRTIAYSFRIGRCTVSGIVPEMVWFRYDLVLVLCKCSCWRTRVMIIDSSNSILNILLLLLLFTFHGRAISLKTEATTAKERADDAQSRSAGVVMHCCVPANPDSV